MRSQAAEAPEKGKEKGSAMNLQINPVDIVVPVYNGYEDLVLCTDSLRRHTDLSLHRVLLIDDRSPDERIRPLLEALAKEGESCGGIVLEIVGVVVEEGNGRS